MFNFIICLIYIWFIVCPSRISEYIIYYSKGIILLTVVFCSPEEQMQQPPAEGKMRTVVINDQGEQLIFEHQSNVSISQNYDDPATYIGVLPFVL